jgi:hypothetical protein
MIRIEGVCMKIRNDAQYDEYFAADFWRVDITIKDTVGHVYIGWAPRLEGENVAWERDQQSLNLPMIVPLKGEQAGEFLGIPKGEDDPYFHLWFDKKGAAVNDEIVGFIRFC